MRNAVINAQNLMNEICDQYPGDPVRPVDPCSNCTGKSVGGVKCATCLTLELGALIGDVSIAEKYREAAQTRSVGFSEVWQIEQALNYKVA